VRTLPVSFLKYKYLKSIDFRGGILLGTGSVVNIQRQGTFTFEEACQVTSIILRITHYYSDQVESMISRIESLDQNQTDLIEYIEGEINNMIKTWNQKIKKLGGEPKGLWKVSFDSGDGFYSWKYPENELGYWCSYHADFSQRIPIAQKI